MAKSIATLALPVLLVATACTVHQAYRERAGSSRQDYPGEKVEDVWKDAIDTLSALNIPVREAENGKIRSRKLEGEGTDGRLIVVVTEREDHVSVYSFMDVRRDYDVDPDGDSLFDNLTGWGPESELDDLKDDYHRGKVSESRYWMKKDTLEEEIEEREAEREAEWEAADRVLINRLAAWSSRFQATLRARIQQRQEERDASR